MKDIELGGANAGVVKLGRHALSDRLVIYVLHEK